ncbi:Na+ xyloside symporter or related transporter [Liquorilactobacillus aquaticus DSM 21051]|uniref:Na+ xyloside symporter or related transporter n=1 Tax=Liquorilactobacillus aquaticus DSM 21051 TaxID=1423725 RepID=A0A0R2DAV9_9LACO|nr:MFS transporter [Liquorilactobacillus aquaticus]KRM97283.1 Na+ xyloside symporter or related transporter [Liquorilactobacillus aquaticus DSM 21051]
MDKKMETKWPERISYGLSDAADNLVFQVMTTYLLFFYTDVYGLEPGAVAILFVVARIADTLESLLIGLMIDRTHSRFGKSRPFFLWYAFPYVIFAILTFVTPNFSTTGKLVWAYITYLGLGFFYTAVNVPITSVLPTMTKNERELTLLGVIRQFCGSSVQIIVAVFTLPLVALFGQGNQKTGFLVTIIVFGAISLVLILNTFFHIRERHTIKEISHQPIQNVVRMLWRNKQWLIISIVIFLYWLVTAIKNQTTIYYFKYALHNESLVPWANSFTLAALVGVLLIMHLTSSRSKKKTMQIGIILAFSGQCLLSVGVYSSLLSVLFIGILINSIGHGIIVGLVSIMIADTIRYGMAMGIQAEGVLASTDDFGVNLGLGFGGLVTAGLFHVSGYLPNKMQNTSTLHMININYVWLPFLIYLLMMAVLYFYDEEKMQHAIKNKSAVK